MIGTNAASIKKLGAFKRGYSLCKKNAFVLVLTEKLKSLDELIFGVFETSPLLIEEQRQLRRKQIEAEKILELRGELQDIVSNYDEENSEICVGSLEDQCLKFKFSLDDLILTDKHKEVLKDFRFRYSLF